MIGTTDEGFDQIVFDLDHKLTEVGVPDDKKYANSKYFFCNISLTRFSGQIITEMEQKVAEISDSIKLEPYTIDSVTLVSGNAVFNRLQKHGYWELRQ